MAACKAAQVYTGAETGIGTLGERLIHRTLKYYFEPRPDCHEAAVGGYVADIVGKDGIIEIQTGSFRKMERKLAAFLEVTNVTVVHPIITKKTIIKVDGDTGERLSRRVSPKRRSVWDTFFELCAIRSALGNPRLRVCVCLLEAEEIRAGKRKISYPTALLSQTWLCAPADYAAFIPEGLPENGFTSADFASKASIRRDQAQSALPVLCAAGVCERVGKAGNSYIYKILV